MTVFLDYWSEKYDHISNPYQKLEKIQNDDGDDYDEKLYDDIEAYDTQEALDNLELGWGLNSSSVVGWGIPSEISDQRFRTFDQRTGGPGIPGYPSKTICY